MEQLIAYIEKIVRLDDKAVQALRSVADEDFFRKNQFILRQDERCDRIWFIKKGMVRKFHLCDGKEITTWIHTENDTFTSLSGYAEEVGSDEFIQACEDTETISITKSNSRKLAEIDAIMEFSNTMMAREFAKIDYHTKIINSKDARGRYEYLGEIAPEIIKRAKLGYIASIIGVSQETLSRIRKG